MRLRETVLLLIASMVLAAGGFYLRPADQRSKGRETAQGQVSVRSCAW